MSPTEHYLSRITDTRYENGGCFPTTYKEFYKIINPVEVPSELNNFSEDNLEAIGMDNLLSLISKSEVYPSVEDVKDYGSIALGRYENRYKIDDNWRLDMKAFIDKVQYVLLQS